MCQGGCLVKEWLRSSWLPRGRRNLSEKGWFRGHGVAEHVNSAILMCGMVFVCMQRGPRPC